MDKIELQKTLLDYATRQTLSHGAMLFAVLSSSFSFLRIVERHADSISPTSLWFVPTSFLVLYVLLAFSIYVIFRILYYGVLITQTFSYPPRPADKNLTDYQNYIMNFNKNKIDFQSRKLIQKIYNVFGIDDFIKIIFWSFFSSAIFSNLLLLAFDENFSTFFCKEFSYSQIIFLLFLVPPFILVVLFREKKPKIKPINS